jgi:hypothetical protein
MEHGWFLIPSGVAGDCICYLIADSRYVGDTESITEGSFFEVPEASVGYLI